MDGNRRVWPIYATMFLVALFVMAGMFIFALFQLNHNLDQKTQELNLLSQQEDQINQQLTILEPYNGSKVNQDVRDFQNYLARMEKYAAEGLYEGEHTFDKTTLPYIFEFYVATNLGTYSRANFSQLLQRVELYLLNWKTTQTFTQQAVESLSIEIMLDEDRDQRAATPVPVQKTTIQNGVS